MTPASRLPFLLALALAGVSSTAAAGVLPDSTVADAWRLANGLEVRARHVPGAQGVAIVLAFRAGTRYEPPRREGSAELLAELEFTAPAGDVPARGRDEMPSLRPLGWNLRTNEQLVVLTEIASREQFPGVLRQVATRLRGVTVTPEAFQGALATVRRDLAAHAFGRADFGLYHRARDLALGIADPELIRRASGQGLDSLSSAEAQARLAAIYVPANASLAIAGDLSGVSVRELIEHEFGGIPGGAPVPARRDPRLVAAVRTATWPGLAHPCGVVAVIAPALDDSLHPAFYLGSLAIGGWFRDQLGAPVPPLTSRFQYSLLDEPDLVRLYPDPAPGATTPASLVSDVDKGLDQLGETEMERSMLEVLRASVDWLIGGPLPPTVREQMRDRAGALGTLAGSMATRALWRGDAFWDLYRRRFETTLIGHNSFVKWMADPSHQVALLFVPGH